MGAEWSWQWIACPACLCLSRIPRRAATVLDLPGIAPEPILDHRQAEGREACRIAVGADDQLGDLRSQAFDDMGEDRLTS